MEEEESSPVKTENNKKGAEYFDDIRYKKCIQEHTSARVTYHTKSLVVLSIMEGIVHFVVKA